MEQNAGFKELRRLFGENNVRAIKDTYVIDYGIAETPQFDMDESDKAASMKRSLDAVTDLFTKFIDLIRENGGKNIGDCRIKAVGASDGDNDPCIVFECTVKKSDIENPSTVKALQKMQPLEWEKARSAETEEENHRRQQQEKHLAFYLNTACKSSETGVRWRVEEKDGKRMLATTAPVAEPDKIVTALNLLWNKNLPLPPASRGHVRLPLEALGDAKPEALRDLDLRRHIFGFVLRRPGASPASSSITR